MKKSLATERDTLAKLSSDPKSEGHIKATERVKEIMKNFHPSEADLARLAGEHGPGGEKRGRLVALTILVTAFIAWQDKASNSKPGT